MLLAISPRYAYCKIIMNKDTTLNMRKAEDRQAATLESLLTHLSRLLPEPAQHLPFRAAMLEPPPACLRLNPLIAPARHLHSQLSSPVPWCPEAFVLQEPENRLGRTLEYVLGTFYIQAKGPTLAVEALQPQPGERVLDLCAAPGGKATQIAAHMRNTGLLLANEPSRKRLPALIGQLERCGVANAIVSKARGSELACYFHNYFDRILLDAPCSGDGVLRKSQAILNYWSVDDARRQSQLQTGLLRAAFHMLRPGGVLVYSTCSLSLEENEQVLLNLLRRYSAQVDVLPIDIFASPPLPREIAAEFPDTFARCARVWPHLHDTEGAFIARLGKKGPTDWHRWKDDAGTWTEEGASPASEAAREQVETQWHFAIPCPDDHALILNKRHLCLQPRAAAAFQARYPFFVRAGMRLARHHKEHYYLTQQAVAMWGERMLAPGLNLTWEQVQTFLAGDSLSLPEPTSLKGEVLVRLDPWTICRGIIEPDGRTLRSMLPRFSRRPDLERLFSPDIVDCPMDL